MYIFTCTAGVKIGNNISYLFGFLLVACGWLALGRSKHFSSMYNSVLKRAAVLRREMFDFGVF